MNKKERGGKKENTHPRSNVEKKSTQPLKASTLTKKSMLNSKVVKWLNGEAMKTTILLEEAVYRRVVEEAVKKYGNTRNISSVVNDILKDAFFSKKKRPTKWSDIRGTLKTDIPTQKLKDLAKEGWGP